jgi:transposase InsO family protein
MTVGPEDAAKAAGASPLDKIPMQYRKYLELFQEPTGKEGLPPHQPWDHVIPLKEGKELRPGPLYQMNQRELKLLKEYIDDMLAKGYLRPSKSPTSSPVIFVPKADPSDPDRPCGDYRALNEASVKDCYSLPLINEMHDRIQGAKIFTKLDLRSAFYLIRIKEGEEWKTAIRTRYGLYEYLVMPFGLTNAPATLQRLMNSILHEYLDIFCMVYLDDILIYSSNPREHSSHVAKVLEKLKGAGLRLKAKKCEFHKDTVGFLGYILTPEGISMDASKVEKILDWPRPTTVKEIQSFLGFANFYRRFIKKYSDISAALTELTKKETVWKWTKMAEEAFQELKSRFTTAPILMTFDPDKKIVLETDASDYAIGACLNQVDDQGKLHPVMYDSRKLSPAELNYDVHDKELLAIVEAFVKWRVYLEGSKYPVQVITDHKNLIYFTTTKILNRRQVRWSETLSSYNFTIQYRKGSENGRADALSRRADYAGRTIERPRQILKMREDGISYNRELLATISVVEDTELEARLKASYSTDENAKRILHKAEGDFSIDLQGLIRFKGLVYIPSQLRATLVRELHSAPAHGHQGVGKTFERIARDYYFPGMRKQVETEVLGCDICCRAKSNRHAPYGLLQSPPTPNRAWESIAFDFVVKLPPSKEPMTNVVYDSVWVTTDRTTKYAHFEPYKEASTATEFAYAFQKTIVSNHGLPKEIISDRDKLFTSKFWTTLMAQLGTNHKLSTAYHPQTDGQTERLNQTMEQYLRCFVNEQQDNWVERLPMAQFAFNSAMSETTKTSPFFANHGYVPDVVYAPRKDTARSAEATLRAEQIKGFQEQLALDIQFYNQRSAAYANKKRSQEPSLKRGDRVYLLRRHIQTKRPSTKLDFKKLGPFKVTEKIGNVNYRLQLPSSSRLHPVFHISLLEPCKGATPVVTDAELQPENDEQEYEAEEILDSRVNNGVLEYLVKWKDYTSAENTWEPRKHLANSPRLLEEFHQRYPQRPSRPSGRGWPAVREKRARRQGAPVLPGHPRRPQN